MDKPAKSLTGQIFPTLLNSWAGAIRDASGAIRPCLSILTGRARQPALEKNQQTDGQINTQYDGHSKIVEHCGLESRPLVDNCNSGSNTAYVSAAQLQLGLYVFLDLPWFQHPFTRNSFRISSEEQIRTLRSLGETRFRYSPELSDVTPSSQTEPPPVASETGDEEAAQEFSAQQKQDKRLTEHRRSIKQVGKAYAKSLGIVRKLNRELIGKPGETLPEMAGLVEQMVIAFLEHPDVTLHVMDERYRVTESAAHDLNVSVLSMMLGKGLALTAEQGRILGLGALLHDIGLTEVPDRVLKKRPEDYTKPERELYARHCEFGLRIGQQLGLSADILAVIFQHHEMADGSGYPLGLTLDKIALPARIVGLVNVYDRLCNPVDPAQAMTPHEALSFMFAQRRNKFDAAILQQIIRCLGVYPPGSLVTLSNQAVGLVMSVNSNKPSRPWVMIYDADVPKSEAILLDLAQQSDLVIAKALRPGQLLPEVAAYLSPRQRIAYYFDSNALTDQRLE